MRLEPKLVLVCQTGWYQKWMQTRLAAGQEGTPDFPGMASLDETGQPTVSPVTPSTGTTEYLAKKAQQEQAADLAEGAAGSPDMLNMNAAIAWLESLAARQGADEATLTTPIEERTLHRPTGSSKRQCRNKLRLRLIQLLHSDASDQVTEPLSSLTRSHLIPG